MASRNSPGLIGVIFGIPIFIFMVLWGLVFMCINKLTTGRWWN